MKYFNTFAFLVLFSHLNFAQKMLHGTEWCGNKGHISPNILFSGTDQRSDSIDILHTTLDVTITDFINKRIEGIAAIKFKPKVTGVTELRLDLLNMTVENVSISGTFFLWGYDSKTITITFAGELDANTEYQVDIVYGGKPVQDASGWGGFYWQTGYAYNLGVGFAADPHNYGRAWFPCFDNFVERCSFTFNITAAGDKMAFCNGQKVVEIELSNGDKLTSWELNDPIPSYLACVAVGPFTSWEKTLSGETGTVPVQIAVAPADTNKLKGSFIHLPEALAAFEYWYGPYRWNKIGYSVVPFNSGAMEHATNIAYMRAAVDGSTNSETLMAHEFSHHWWGDLATCSTAEDMWLNEGWASYSEHIFLEKVYGNQRYIDAVQSNFLNVLENAHVAEGGYRAVSGVPHNLTYGTHVYNKGAVVAHSLRGYMTDEQFRTGLRAVMDQTQFTDFSSESFRDKMSAATGIDLNAFFDNWVFSPGFVDFTIDSVQVIPNLPQQTVTSKIYVKQRLRGAPTFYFNVPLEFTFEGPNNTKVYKTATVNGEQSVVSFTFSNATLEVLSYYPHLNTRQRILQARAVSEQDISAAGNFSFAPAKMDLKVNTLGVGTAKIRTEYHYATPDIAGATTPDMKLTNRFWVVESETLEGFDGSMTFFYDGRGQADQLDKELFASTSNKEDSIRLLYRPGPGHVWTEHPNYTKNTLGSMVDKWGFLKTNNVLPGEYTIAKAGGTTPANEVPELPVLQFSVSPNPASSQITIQTDAIPEHIWVVDNLGKVVKDQSGNSKIVQIDQLPAGAYHLILLAENGGSGSCTFVVR